MKIKMNKLYFDAYSQDFFIITRYNKNKSYPYKIVFKNQFDVKSNWVTKEYLLTLAKITDDCFTKQQVKILSETLKAFNMTSVLYGN